MAGRGVRTGLAVELAVLLGLGVLLGLLGPFGTFALVWPWRLLDWLVFVGGGALFFRPVIGAARVLARHGAMRLPAGLACACLLAAFPATLLVAWCLAGLGWPRLTAGALAALYPQVLLVGGLATAAQLAIASRRGPAADAPEAAADGPDEAERPAGVADAIPRTIPGAIPGAHPVRLEPAPGPAPTPEPGASRAARAGSFLSRLPPALGRDLLCLENEDHYVRAHTALGSTLILMRLGDAVAELDGIDGMRTHRSWWVARSAVRGVVRRDRTVALALANGIEAPVARATVPILRQAGWLTDGDAGRIAPAPSSTLSSTASPAASSAPAG